MKNTLKQLNRYHDELLESLESTRMKIIEAECDKRNTELSEYQNTLVGKYFKFRKFDMRIYKILEITEIRDDYVYCSAIRVTPDEICAIIIAHNSHSIEITKLEFDTKFAETLNNLNQKIK